jgi:hypothetical protein
MEKLEVFSQLPTPNQCPQEWQLFLEFCQAYFLNRTILNPVVVEIGVEGGRQKKYYEYYLGATHIGIDINPETRPDIVGDSRSKETKAALIEKLKGRPINLLFIDGGHEFETVRSDFEMYGSLVSNIIAFHDLFGIWTDVKAFWESIQCKGAIYKVYTSLTFFRWRPPINPGDIMGIGVLVKM